MCTRLNEVVSPSSVNNDQQLTINLNFILYLACQDVLVCTVSIGQKKFLRVTSRVLLQLEVDAILPSPFVVRLVLVPGHVSVYYFGAVITTPGPTSSAVLLGSRRPVVEVAIPGSISGQVAQTLEFPCVLNEQRLHSKTATRLPVLLPVHLFYFVLYIIPF
jgi:hypothetical protein